MKASSLCAPFVSSSAVVLASHSVVDREPRKGLYLALTNTATPCHVGTEMGSAMIVLVSQRTISDFMKRERDEPSNKNYL